MKRLAFWIIVGLVAINVVSRRESRARDDRRHRQMPTRTQVIVTNYDSSDDDDSDGTSIVIKRNKAPKPAEPPQAPELPRAPGVLRAPEAPKAPRIPGKRVKKATPKPPTLADSNRPMPEWFPRDRVQEAELAKPDRQGRRVLVGPLSASREEARQATLVKLRREVADWISVDVPASWPVADADLDALVRDSYVQPVLFDLEHAGLGLAMGAASTSAGTDNIYTIYKGAELVDFSDASRDRLVHVYQKQLVRGRMLKGGGILAFALVCLASVAGYIRADEATKGYYTRRLKLVSMVGVGAAGFALYRMFLA